MGSRCLLLLERSSYRSSSSSNSRNNSSKTSRGILTPNFSNRLSSIKSNCRINSQAFAWVQQLPGLLQTSITYKTTIWVPQFNPIKMVCTHNSLRWGSNSPFSDLALLCKCNSNNRRNTLAQQTSSSNLQRQQLRVHFMLDIHRMPRTVKCLRRIPISIRSINSSNKAVILVMEAQ